MALRGGVLRNLGCSSRLASNLAIGAQGFTVPHRLRHLVLLAVTLSLATGCLAADLSPAVKGVVRDARGVPQMGVLVELLGPGTTQSVLTDLQGRYSLRSAAPGIYQLRASATLFLPALRRQLLLRAGSTPIVNLTLTGLFDDTGWLPARPRHAGESPEDWKWTLRAPANRPMLRLIDDGSAGLELSAERSSRTSERHGVVGVTAASGNVGDCAREASARLLDRSSGGDRERLLAISVGSARLHQGTPVAISGRLTRGNGHASVRHLAVSLRSLPQISTGDGQPFGRSGAQGLTVLELRSGERVELGEFGAAEFGGETQFLSAGRSTLVTHPFLRLSAQPIDGWMVSYALLTSPTLRATDDLLDEEVELPTVITSPAGLRTEMGLHQELRLRRAVGRARLQVAYFHDLQHQTAISGLLPASSKVNPILAGSQVQGVMLDTNNGAFRALTGGYISDGYSVNVNVPVGSALTVTGAYWNAEGVVLEPARGAPVARLAAHRGQSVLMEAQGRLVRSGTRLTASYRWQPARVVSVLAPYESETPAYLGVHLRQPLPLRRILPAGAQLAVDGNNLLAQGYQSFPVLGTDAILASALREIRAGLLFTF